jgi:23S rRNA (guanosine2251-2'-O)-methyltransferase
MGDAIVAGRQPVLEALRSGAAVEKILILFGAKGAAIERIRALAKKRGVPVSEASKQRFRELAEDATTQGVVAILAQKAYVEVEDLLAIAASRNELPFLLVLDEVEDPHNVGALIRTAECAGMHGVIIPKHHAASLGQTVAKTSAGASLHLAAARVSNIAQTLDTLRQNGVWIVGADAEGDKLYTDVNYDGPLAIVIGSEGRGIRRLVKEKCDVLVRIPLYGSIGSLNASVAGGVLMYEAAKGRHAKRG